MLLMSLLRGGRELLAVVVCAVSSAKEIITMIAKRGIEDIAVKVKELVVRLNAILNEVCLSLK